MNRSSYLPGDFLDTFEGGSELADALIEAFLEDPQNRPSVLNKIYKSGDLKQIAIKVHTLKGTVGIFGTNIFWHELKEIDDLLKNKQGPKALLLFPNLISNYKAFYQEVEGLSECPRTKAG